MKTLDLKDWLSYENKNVIYSFCKKFEIDTNVARQVFEDMIRFLWMNNRYDSKDLNVIDTPILIIDEMWHIFILHTKDYQEFCNNYIGTFFHHIPSTKEDAEEFVEYMGDPRNRESYVESKRARYKKIYDILGEDTFERWFLVYPKEFSRERIKAARKV